MAANRKMKVYRTPTGFHDAYVAAPSQKAALQAWGADANLFARGVAEVVTDPKLTKEPLSQPGVIVRKARGTAAEHIDALPKTKARAAKRRKGLSTEHATKDTPRPSRAAMDEAEQAIAEGELRHDEERRAIIEREKRLTEEKRKLEQAQRSELDGLQQTFDRAKAHYQKAVRIWEA